MNAKKKKPHLADSTAVSYFCYQLTLKYHGLRGTGLLGFISNLFFTFSGRFRDNQRRTLFTAVAFLSFTIKTSSPGTTSETSCVTNASPSSRFLTLLMKNVLLTATDVLTKVQVIAKVSFTFTFPINNRMNELP